MEALCPDCPLQQLEGELQVENNLEYARVHTEDEADCRLLAELPQGVKFIEALQQARPARCTNLRTLLPREPRSRRSVHFWRCPELGLRETLPDEN